jgi:hypothetical protein
VIKNGQISLAVPAGRVGITVSSLTTLAAAEGGFVASTRQSMSNSLPTGGVTLRIPEVSFEDTVARVRALGKVEQSTTSGQDVTAQYVDLTDQITALRAAQGRYLAILARANSIGDILAVQQQVDAVDSQLQQLEGQQRVLDDQTTYGTLTVNVEQASATVQPRPAPGPWRTAVLRAANGFADALQTVIAASGSLAFAVLFALFIAGAGWLSWRRLGVVRTRRAQAG